MYQGKNYKIYNDDCLIELENMEENSIDSIVTDPPYELNFMNKGWDNAGVSFQKETWEKCLKVLKPGGYLLAFGGSRTFHRIAVAIEDAGFEIRDTIMWIYGSGFPKSMNIGLEMDKRNGVESPIVGQNLEILKKQAKDLENGHRKIQDSFNLGNSSRNNGFKNVSADIKEAQNEWKGWGTCLKPSFEPIIVARKPFKGSLVDNIAKWGVGGINIDECRVPAEQGEYDIRHYTKEDCFQNLKPKASKFQVKPQPIGRFPANTILTYDQITFDEVCGGFPYTKSVGGSGQASTQNTFANVYGKYNHSYISNSLGGFQDSGSASRYFYCAKASRKDRDEGLDEFEQQKVNDGRKKDIDNAFQRGITLRHNIHPTVKPTELMQYLVRLVTPKGGILLDPFMGSGSTGKAVMYENKERQANYTFIGIEKEKEYCDIAEVRIEYVSNKD